MLKNPFSTTTATNHYTKSWYNDEFTIGKSIVLYVFKAVLPFCSFVHAVWWREMTS